jgi:hypothetical protein
MGEPDAGERWPWMMRVKGMLSLPVDQAPHIDDL